MNNLKKEREAVGLTQKKIAQLIGISEHGYQNYESNRRIPNVYTAQKIAKILGKQVEELFPLSKL
ncbi:hypothetical protein Hs30E_19500 [Lactococcus hodotermopsidis]|uniref:HTH cro/C1-type domain-containing protein n=1 Tax=Pseudolactococcus hodotermopsidis TaxID=2709157 RepID=A0A6A0BD93_9LACT|nr:helix-turn-helix transcriptional regulator [Lactococcus hodotermopsidis]GFH43399.1 hypothetical protein Hs30E_19500 [Lactococcus hodotermopsidis]